MGEGVPAWCSPAGQFNNGKGRCVPAFGPAFAVDEHGGHGGRIRSRDTSGGIECSSRSCRQ
jgi:hypothetical protein